MRSGDDPLKFWCWIIAMASSYNRLSRDTSERSMLLSFRSFSISSETPMVVTFWWVGTMICRGDGIAEVIDDHAWSSIEVGDNERLCCTDPVTETGCNAFLLWISHRRCLSPRLKKSLANSQRSGTIFLKPCQHKDIPMVIVKFMQPSTAGGSDFQFPWP